MRKTGLMMLLIVALLLSVQFAVFGVEPTKDGITNIYSVISESKIAVREEVADLFISENMTAIAAEPIQTESGFYNLNFVFCNDYPGYIIMFNIPNYFMESNKNTNIRFLPGGILIYSGFV